MKVNWWAGAKSAIAFGLGGVLTIGIGKLMPEFVILFLLVPGILIGLLFAIFNKQDLNDKRFLLRSPLLFSMGSVGAGAITGVTLMAIGSLFSNSKSIAPHFAWVSGLIFSLVVSTLIVSGHSYTEKKASITTMTAVGTSLAFFNGLYFKEALSQSIIDLPSLLWLTGFGFAVGMGLQRRRDSLL